jgi:putative flippase GtrA
MQSRREENDEQTSEPLPAPNSETLVTRAYRFARALIVGSGATLADFSVFTTCVRAIGLAPAVARVPALLVGASLQFFGNRSFTFRAQSGSRSRQAKLFLIMESITFGLNWSVFYALERAVRQQVPPELVGFAGSFFVFVGFAYPVRRLIVFRLPR